MIQHIPLGSASHAPAHWIAAAPHSQTLWQLNHVFRNFQTLPASFFPTGYLLLVHELNSAKLLSSRIENIECQLFNMDRLSILFLWKLSLLISNGTPWLSSWDAYLHVLVIAALIIVPPSHHVAQPEVSMSKLPSLKSLISLVLGTVPGTQQVLNLCVMNKPTGCW